jgi:luciferase family oxidoreductase group 1
MDLQLGVVDQSPVASGASPADALANTIDLARRCDEWGYTRYWLAEHHATEMLAGPAPEVLMARVAAETQRIRVGSGGVMLPHYSPFKVAESFQLLETLHPGRIDLGVGRAPGGTPLVTHALQRFRGEGQSSDDFAAQLVELLAWIGDGFPASHPYSRVALTPATPTPPEVWLLGSSPWSAIAAAQLGLPYCFASFINPEPARSCLAAYQERFDRTAGGGSAPRAMLALGAIVADTDDEAQRLQMSVKAMRHRIMHGGRGPVPTPEEAIAELGQEPGPIRPWVSGEWPRYLTGRPGPVVEQLARIAAEAKVDEILVVTIAHDHEARCRSYELLAKEVFG